LFDAHLAPKRNVDKVSSIFHIEGEQAIKRVVLEFPPNESLRRKVSLLSRNGTDFCRSLRALMHRPSTTRDLLINLAYTKTDCKLSN